jgi:predicted Zn-dependent protease
MLFRTVPLILVAVVGASFAAPAHAQLAFIRDAEVESIIRSYATPLFEAAGLDSQSVKVMIVNSGKINAFVAGGKKLFLNTGLLLAAKGSNQVIGVIAHETGHIAGGHLARTHEVLKNANAASILSYVLGAAALVAGAPSAALAIVAGGSAVSQQTFLKYSRGQEQAADQSAVTTLDRTGQSARGLLAFLEVLEKQEVLVIGRQDPYLRTHPLVSGRVDFVRNHVANSPYSDVIPSPREQARFARMIAKLRGFLSPREAFRLYPEEDQSIEARYARAIAHYRRPDLAPALEEIDGLLEDYPGDGYFHELKGQILFENGRIDAAVLSYRRAVDIFPDAPLIRVGLAQAMVETGDQAALVDAVEQLEIAVRQDAEDPLAWRLLSIAYGRTDRLGMSALASAERAILVGDHRGAVAFAERADNLMPAGTPGQLRAQDIVFVAKQANSKR